MTKKNSIKRTYHPYWKWEETQFNMWGKTDDKDMLSKAIQFTGDHQLYGSFMQRVVREWPFSCEHNLSDTAQNRRAWVGHAAVALALGCPEDITRQAWHHLTQEQQDLANAEADKAINYWEENYAKN